MTIKVTANQDFVGVVEETVPAGFEIFQSNNLTTQQFNNIATQNGQKVITWDVDWRKGEKHELNYTLKFPRESPQFYLVGPLRLASSREERLAFSEQRQWQIAADVVSTLFMETPDATQAKEFWSSVTGTVTYDTAQKKSGLASWKADSGAGNAAAYLERVLLLPNGTSTGARVSGYFRLANLPGGTTTIFRVGGVYLRVTSGGVLQLWDATTAQVGSNGSTIKTATWYGFCVVYTTGPFTPGVNSAKLFLDGTQDIDDTVLAFSLSRTLDAGWFEAPGASLILNFHHSM